jgi:hypothetical protein
MGVGYQVSPLHRLIRLDTAALQQRPIVRGESSVLEALANATGAKTVASGPLPTRSPTVERILAWRQVLVDEYNDRLGEQLTWDERSTFATSEDVATSGDVAFRYAANVVDQLGQARLRDFIDRPERLRDDMVAAFAEAERRGSGGRFPQLLLGARIWLPFERNLIIEWPNWDGRTDRYGSVFRLVDEVAAVRVGIADTDPSVVQYAESDDSSDQFLASAWQASATILRLATLAATKRLPLLTTG